MSRGMSAPTPSLGAPFSRLYREHGPLVRSALRQLGVPPASLEDATQDVFVVLHRRAAEFDRTRSLKNWLWGIARGVASTYRRSDRRRTRLLGELPRERANESLDRELARGEAVEILHRFLGGLDADKCAVFVLAEVEGRSGPEISRMLAVNVNTVYARLRAARRGFRSAVAEHHEPDARPLFSAWLPFLGWPRGASALAGAGALALALALPTEPEVDAPVVALATPVIPDAIVPAAVAAGGDASLEEAPAASVRARRPMPPTVPEAIVIEMGPDLGADDRGEDAEGSLVPRRAPRRARRRAATPAPTPAPIVIEGPAQQVAAEPPARPPERPWGEQIVARGHAPEPTPLFQVRGDFVDTLVDVTDGI